MAGNTEALEFVLEASQGRASAYGSRSTAKRKKATAKVDSLLTAKVTPLSHRDRRALDFDDFGTWVEERQRLARDLHDSFPQEFQVILLHLRLALSDGETVDARRYVQGAMQAAENGLRKARLYIGQLRSSTASLAVARAQRCPRLVCVRGLVELALSEALGRLKIRSALEGDKAPRFICSSIEEDVTLIVREAVRNAVKHADATEICCSVRERDGTILVSVRDNGRGFCPANVELGGFGIRGMRERAKSVGGALQIAGRPGGGTTVRLRVPAAHTEACLV
ncbi:MAG: ATP-binding protein [Burkholderiaceae bacterium]|jgi:signal transduction histidine kinase